MDSRHTKILVLGGGPAGAAAAMTLSAMGHRPLLVSAPRRQAAVEGFSDRTMQALETLGFSRALSAVGPKVGRRAFWGAEETRVNEEFVVERAPFDEALLVDAADKGVEVIRDRATRVTRAAGMWQVQLSASATLTAEFLIEARGRAAPVPSRDRLQGPATVSLARVWHGVEEHPATAITALPDGWAWYASPGGGQGMLQFLISAEPGELPKRHGLTDRYSAILRDAGLPARWVSGAEAVGDVVVRRANPIGANDPLGEGFVRIGDAAVAPDPLSGHGVYVALGGAQAAAVTVNTLLRKPENTGLAYIFYRERCALDFMRLCRVGRAFYEQEQHWADRHFWQARSQWPDREPPHPPMDAFPAQIERRPVVDHGFVSEQEVVVTPDHPRGVWVVDGVPLVPFCRAMRDSGNEVDVEAAAATFRRPVTAIENALNWLIARSLL